MARPQQHAHLTLDSTTHHAASRQPAQDPQPLVRQQHNVQKQDQDQDQEDVYSGTTAPVLSSTTPACWLLAAVQLLAVQPACLQVYHQQPHAPGQVLGQHHLLLHLELALTPAANVSSISCCSPAATTTAGVDGIAGARILTSSAAGPALNPPMLLSSASLELVVLNQSMQRLLQQQVGLEQLVLQQHQDLLYCAACKGSSRSVCLNLSITFPAQPSQTSLDALHLLLTVQQTAASNSSSSSRLAVLVAEVPLLLLPAAAQQEVQQLLLPAMRQEVQADMAEHVEQPLQPHSDEFGWQIMHVESAVWKHFYQLSRDIYTVMQLAAASAVSAASGTEPAAEATAGTAAVLQLSQGACPPPPAAALEHLSGTLVLPLLLPFLAAHGLYSMQRLLLSCLPVHLQQQWQQQQLSRLQSLAALEGSVGSSKAGPGQKLAAENVATPEGDAMSCAGAAAVTQPSLRANTQQQQRAGTATSSTTHATAQQTAGTNPALSSAGVSWVLPLTGFSSPVVEQRYVDWKHRSLQHLDMLSAVFDVFYLVVLLKRMLREPTTLFYFLFIVIKTLPHVPLMLGYRELFLRHRELWLFLIGPACAVLTWLMAAGSVYILKQPPLLLTASAFKAFWQGRGEIVTGTMRPFMQHMRLKPYIAYVVIDAMTSSWIMGQTVGYAAAGSRWGLAAVLSVSLCWGLELHMRRHFVAQQNNQVQQQNLRKELVHDDRVDPPHVSVAAVNKTHKMKMS